MATLVGSASANTGSAGATTLNITLPQGIQAGDMILIYVASNTADPYTVPAGYASISGAAVGQALQANIFYKTAVDTFDSGKVVTLTVPAVSGPGANPVIVVNPGGGSGARATAGVHADDNLFQQAPYDPNSTPVAYARGAAASGFTQTPHVDGSNAGPPAWGMIEASPSLTGSPARPGLQFGYGQQYALYDNLATSPAGNFSGNPGIGWPTPRWCFSMYGNFNAYYVDPITHVGADFPAYCQDIATPGFTIHGQTQTVDQFIIDWCSTINKVAWPQISIRYGWEIEISSTWPVTFTQNTPTFFKAAWIHIHDLMNAHLTVPVLWEWNAFALPGAPNQLNAAGFKTTDYYPGDQYVDIIGCDGYCQNGVGADLTFLAPMKQAQIFAAAHGKTVAFSEWGLLDTRTGGATAPMDASGTGDNGVGIRSVNAVNGFLNMIDSFPPAGSPGACQYHMFFQGNPGGAYFAWQYYPNALAAYKARLLKP